MGGVGEEGKGRWKTDSAESSDGLGFLRAGQIFPTVPRGWCFCGCSVGSSLRWKPCPLQVGDGEGVFRAVMGQWAIPPSMALAIQWGSNMYCRG